MSRIRSHHADMEFVEIPGTSMRVSRIALGTWAIGGWMGAAATRTMRSAPSTQRAGARNQSDRYNACLWLRTFGRNRRRSARRRGPTQAWFIATKGGLDWKDGKPFRKARKAKIIEEADNLLRRLQTDVIDLYQVRWPDPHTPFAEVPEAMGELHRAGKIRAIGVSNFNPAQMKEFRKVAPLHAAQPTYNLFERAIEQDVLPHCHCRARNITVLACGSLCRGPLSGGMSKSSRFTGDDLCKDDPKFLSPRFEQYLAAVERLDRFALSSADFFSRND